MSKTLKKTAHLAPSAATIAPRGFSLIELMVAITLGILLSIGLVTLFAATSKSNRVQDAMAQVQENGRYAVSRLNNDLRMVAHQRQNVSGFVTAAPTAAGNPNGVVNPTVAADVYVATIALPDFNPATGLSAPASWPAGTPWPLSQRYSIQGYECSSSTCTPAIPSGTARDLPAAGTTVGKRLNTADVLTMRYLNADGWALGKNELTEVTSSGSSCSGGNLTSIKVTPATGSAAFNFVANDLAMLVVGSRTEIFQVDVAGTTLTPKNVVGGTVPCFSTSPGANVTLYNFSNNFITVTYYIQLNADPNDAARVIPVLVRRQSSIDTAALASTDQELVQGVEQLDFLVGIQRTDGKVSYLTSDNVGDSGQSSYANCPPEPQQYVTQMPTGTAEPDCLWRAVTSIEAHLLVDNIKNVYDLIPSEMAYQYGYGYSGNDVQQTPGIPGGPLPSGLAVGNMLRREFVSLVSVRNYNP